jgi:hypothetical protein
MICYTKGHFVIGSGKKIFYFRVNDILDQYNTPDWYGKEIDLPVEPDMLKCFAVGNNFEFKGFIDVGTGNVAMLMEDKDDFNLSFIRIQKISELDGVDLVTTGMDGGGASRN